MANKRSRYLTLCLALAAALISFFPIYWMIMSAILPTTLTMSRNPPLIPPLDAISLQAFVEVFTRKPVFTWLFNSIAVTASTITIVTVVSTMAGYSLSRYSTKAQQAMGFVLLTSKMLPLVLMVIPLFILYSQTGLIETYTGLVIALSAAATPFASWMLKGFFDAIPREMEQAAKIDGCNEFQALIHIILPIVRPGMAAVAAYVAIVTWADLVFSRTLMSRPDHWLINVGLQSFAGEYLVDWAALMAAATISLLPMSILFFFLEPFLVKGMTKGSLAN